MSVHFPHLAHLDGANEIEITPEDLAHPLNALQIVGLIDSVLRDVVAEEGAPAIHSAALGLLEDVVNLRATAPAAAIDFLTLCLSSHAISVTASIRRFDLAWIWAMAPCVDDVPANGAVDFNPAKPFLAAHVWRQLSEQALFEWGGAVCYLANRGGYAWELAVEIAPELAAAVLELGPGADDMELSAAGQVTEMLARTGRQEGAHAAQHLEHLLEATEADPQTRIGLAIVLASSHVAPLTEVSTQDRATWALAELGEHARGHERIQLLVSAIGSDPDQLAGRCEELCAAIDEYNATFNDDDDERLDRFFVRARTGGVLEPAISELIQAGDLDTSRRLLARWNGVPPEETIETVSIACAPKDSSVLWCTQGHASSVNHETVVISQTLNEAFGNSLFDPERPGLVPVSERPGLPVGGLADGFGAAVQTLLQPQEGAVLAEEVGGAAGLVHLGEIRLPSSYALTAAGGPTLPLVVSFERPDTARDLARAEIWYGVGDGLANAELEATAVARILREGGVDVGVVNAAEATTEDFEHAYENPELDLLWVVSHGDVDGWDHDRMALQLTDDVEIALRSIARLNAPDAGRRLLVLNVCDGGFAHSIGVGSRIGFAGVCAGRAQSVVSHLWPVNWRVASAFGLLLAVGLVDEASHLDAFRFATTSLADAQHLLDGRVSAEAIDLVPGSYTYFDLASPVFVI